MKDHSKHCEIPSSIVYASLLRSAHAFVFWEENEIWKYSGPQNRAQQSAL